MYDVAVPYAREQWEYVQKFVERLKSYNINVFFDKTEENTIWGENLYQKLAEVYRTSTYCVVFLSKDYLRKKWTAYEGNIIQERMHKDYNDKTVTVLPVRFDDEQIRQIPFPFECMNAIEVQPDVLASYVFEKILKNASWISSISHLCIFLNTGITEYIKQNRRFKINCTYLSDNIMEIAYSKNDKKQFFIYLIEEIAQLPFLYIYFGNARPLDLVNSCSAEFYYDENSLFCINYSLFHQDIGRCFEIRPQRILDTITGMLSQAGRKYWLC